MKKCERIPFVCVMVCDGLCVVMGKNRSCGVHVLVCVCVCGDEYTHVCE